MLKRLGHGSQAKVNLAIKVNENQDGTIDMETYIPEYFAIKVYIKPSLKRQRSFMRSSGSNGRATSDGSTKRKNQSFL